MDTAKVFKSGNSQAVRLPKKYALEATEVFIERRGESLVLTPRKGAWDDFWAGLDRFSEDFMSDRDQPPMQERDGL